MKLLGLAIAGLVISYSLALLWAVDQFDRCFGEKGS